MRVEWWKRESELVDVLAANDAECDKLVTSHIVAPAGPLAVSRKYGPGPQGIHLYYF